MSQRVQVPVRAEAIAVAGFLLGGVLTAATGSALGVATGALAMLVAGGAALRAGARRRAGGWLLGAVGYTLLLAGETTTAVDTRPSIGLGAVVLFVAGGVLVLTLPRGARPW